MRRLLLVLLLCGCGLSLPTLAAESAPAALAAWKDWVLHGSEWQRCPLLLGRGADDQRARPCAWPGPLQLDVDQQGARFAQVWEVRAESLLPLPGDARHPVQGLRVDGLEAAVLMHDGRPAVWLPPGHYRLEGSLGWSRRPERLPVPAKVGLIELRLDGRALERVQRDGPTVWLGRAAEVKENDALGLRVYRRLADGTPLRLSTWIELEVAGRAREVGLGPALPEGFVATALNAELPATWSAEGQLRLQLRPGSWTVQLEARALQPQLALAAVRADPPWPTEEVWSWQANPQLRVVQVESPFPVDPLQVGSPWEGLPAFLLRDDAQLTLQERSRGLAADAPHRLHLQRQAWLDFSGAGLTVRDRISGELARPDRLDMQDPWQLLRAHEAVDDLLVTAGAEPGLWGVELRRPQINLDTTARLPRGAGDLATGWAQDFEVVSYELQLPPGWQLWHAAGADAAPGAWWTQWTLLDLFLLALAVLLAQRLLGLSGAALIGGYLLLAYHQPGAPLWTLLGAVLLALLGRQLGPGLLHTSLRWGQRALLLLALLWALPFAWQQLQWALYPALQLRAEHAYELAVQFDHSRSGVIAEEAPIPMSMPAPAPMAKAVPAERLDRIEVTGSRISAADQLSPYRDDAMVQAGPGLPDWQGQTQTLVWRGPVSAEQTLSLWLSPPWLSGLLRVFSLVLLGALGYRLLRDGGRWRLAPLAVAAVLAAPAQAAEFPSAELLEQYRQRLLEAPRCVPHCAALASAELRIRDERLWLSLGWQALHEGAVPIPLTGPGETPSELRLDQRLAALWQQDGKAWLLLPAGQHRAELSWPLSGLDSLDLHFPLTPARLRVELPGWEAVGLDGERLSGDTLQLLRRRELTGGGERGQPAAAELPAFVEVRRRLSLDIDWTLTTSVTRIAPASGGFSLRLPLLPGEQLQDSELEVSDGQVRLDFAAGEQGLQWRSRLPIGSEVRLQQGDWQQASEIWEIAVAPIWHARFSALPELASGEAGIRRFQPLPGEALAIEVSAPAALPGATAAVDSAQLTYRIGQRAGEAELQLRLRSTRGGQQVLQLPAEAELLGVEIQGQSHALRLDQGRLQLPLLPGEQALQVRFRLNQPIGLSSQLPSVDLGAASANITSRIELPAERWVLWASGDGRGPALLLWPQLLLMIALAAVLARIATPLRFRHWLLLGLGFAAVSWWAALWVVGWLLLLHARERHAGAWTATRGRFIAGQLLLLLVSLSALLCLLAAIPYGLLGQPDMQIVGDGSAAQSLQWFLDRSSGLLPSAYVISLPLWLYQGAILAWSLWLAHALLGWLRWGWRCYSAAGYWPAPLPATPAAAADPEPAPPT